MSSLTALSIEEILNELGLQELHTVFQEQGIDEEALKLLGDAELKELVPKIGLRLKLKKYIESTNLTFSILDNFLPTTPTSEGGSSASECRGGAIEGGSPANEHGDGASQGGSCNTDDVASVAAPHTVKDILNECLDGRVILKEGEGNGGLLKEGSRRKLSQLVINKVIEDRPSRKITAEDFYKLASQIVELFPRERVVVYYSAYQSGQTGTAKKNASGKLYESYITRRRKLRQSGELVGTSRASSSSSKTSISTTVSKDTNENDYEEQLIWLKNNVEPWNTVEQKWTETSDYRLKYLYNDGTIADYYNKYPALKQPNGYTLLLNDFNQMYPLKENCLFSILETKYNAIIEYAKDKIQNIRDKKVKSELQDLIGKIDDNNHEDNKAIALMLLPYVINISPARKRKDKPALKFSRVEICDAYIKQVPSEVEVTNYIISKRDLVRRQERSLQPFVLFVGESICNVNIAYVVVNDTLYSFKKLITALDCVFKIFQATGACYPLECEDIWMFIQIGFYGITTKFDRKSQVVNTLLTDLGLI